MGQGWVLQFWVALWAEQPTPPLALRVMTLFVRVWRPPPHWLLHLPQRDHPLTLQLIGQAKDMHVVAAAR